MAVPCGFLRSAASRAERRVETCARQATTAAPGASSVADGSSCLCALLSAAAGGLPSQPAAFTSPAQRCLFTFPRGECLTVPCSLGPPPCLEVTGLWSLSQPPDGPRLKFIPREHITWRRSQEQGAARRQSRQSTGQCTGARTAGQVDRDVAVAPGKGHGALLGSLSEGRGGGRARAIQGPVLEKCGVCPGIMANLLKAVKCTSDTVRSRVSKGDPSSRGEQAGGDRPVTGQLQKPKEPGRACSLEPSGCGLWFKSSQPWVHPGDATWREGTLVRWLVPSEGAGDQESPAECPQDVRCRGWEDLPSPRRTGRQALVEQTGGVEILERRGC